MGNTLKKRLRSQAGETISEVLISLLIAALALTMLAAMISATVNMVTTSKTNMNEYYKQGQELDLQAGNAQATATIATIATASANVKETPDVFLHENTFFSDESKKVFSYSRKP